jgi:hypothetical protein
MHVCIIQVQSYCYYNGLLYFYEQLILSECVDFLYPKFIGHT